MARLGCKQCGGELCALGSLGSVQWFRCRRCGYDQPRKVRKARPYTDRLFKVAVVSTNTNAFGLHAFWFMAKDGQTFQALGNSLRVEEFKTGTIHSFTIGREEESLAKRGFECPQRSLTAPAKVAREVWGKIGGSKPHAKEETPTIL